MSTQIDFVIDFFSTFGFLLCFAGQFGSKDDDIQMYVISYLRCQNIFFSQQNNFLSSPLTTSIAVNGYDCSKLTKYLVVTRTSRGKCGQAILVPPWHSRIMVLFIPMIGDVDGLMLPAAARSSRMVPSCQNRLGNMLTIAAAEPFLMTHEFVFTSRPKCRLGSLVL